jgi:hypothetical protein
MADVNNIKKFYEKIGVTEKDTINVNSARQFRRNTIVSAAFSLKLSEEVIIRPIVCRGLNIANIIFSGENKYISAGDVPVSSDGEFRTNLVDLENFMFNPTNEKKVEKIYVNFRSFILTPLNEKDIVKAFHIIMNILIIDIKKGYPGNFSTRVRNLFTPFLKKYFLPGEGSNMFVMPIKFSETKKSIAIGLGTKIVPLYIDDIKILQDFGKNINLEIKVGIAVTKMIFNGIIFGCPMLCKWSVFKTEDLNIFTGHEILDNYKNSRKYVKNIRNLYEAADIDEKTETVKTFRAKTRAVINYAEKRMILSKYCVLLVMDLVGRTLADYMLNVLDLNEPNFTNDLPSLKSFVFQITYTLFCLNKFQGIVHGDLHFNNITVRPTAGGNNFTQYKIEGKNYFLPSNIIYNIIDFGRVLQAPSTYIMQPREISSFHVKRLIKFFARILPETYAKNREDIENLAFSDGDQLFQIAEVLDIYHVISDTRIILEKYLVPAVRGFLDEIRIFIINWVETSINLLKNREALPRVGINQTILEKFFTDCMEPCEVDLFLNADSENKYNPGDFEFKVYGKDMAEGYEKAESNVEKFFKKKLPMLEAEIKEYYLAQPSGGIYPT